MGMLRQNSDESVQEINALIFILWISGSDVKTSGDMAKQRNLCYHKQTILMVTNKDNTRSKGHRYF